MKTILIAASAALFVSGSALAQMEERTTFTIEPAHRTVIKQYVVKEHIRPVQVKERIALGAVLPADIELQTVPEAWVTDVPEVRNYEYIDWNGKVVFVEPKTRKVVQIVE
ncbi:MAG: DUF1236 domain-containing protein [Rhizomicrobium sp.]